MTLAGFYEIGNSYTMQCIRKHVISNVKPKYSSFCIACILIGNKLVAFVNDKRIEFILSFTQRYLMKHFAFFGKGLFFQVNQLSLSINIRGRLHASQNLDHGSAREIPTRSE